MKRKILWLALFLVVLVLVAWLAERHLSLDQLVAYEDQLRGWVRLHAWTAFAVGLVAYVLISFVPGSAGKSLVCGWLYGLWPGTVLVNVALTVTAMLSFLIARCFFREAIESRWSLYLRRINQALERDGAFYLFTMRVLHIPYTFTNYVMGATSIRTINFWWATQLGMLPGNIIFVYAGSQLPTLRALSTKGALSVFTPGLILALLAVSVLPWILRWTLRRMPSRRSDRRP